MNRSNQAGMRDKAIIVLLVALGLVPVRFAEAQQPKEVPLVGVLSPGSPRPTDSYAPLVEAFRQGLHDLAYVEGKNVLLEYRYAEGKLDRMPGLVAELVQLKPAVILMSSLVAIRAAKQATKIIPIVMILSVDRSATGLWIASLGPPGMSLG